MTETATQPKIVIGGKEYNAEDLTQQQRELVALHQKWTFQLRESREDTIKTELAIQNISQTIARSIDESSKENETASAPEAETADIDSTSADA